ncbi:helix-turn-helix transcriptional regulator [Caloranaerobacter ferrireducens]|uniref:helix-turn-helix transcriptional regulator n=1 Tax=Caloranaerobacter ferrireducens TaxID=1323370 RepID=UPI00084D1F6B|nr:helix-turn-helix transcriptional regulator [Caloranaerobacter ferrireducens]
MSKEEYILVNHIRTIRRGKADITQQELADAVGCTRQTIAALEQQKYNPSLILAMKIAKVLDVTVDQLFELKKK